MNSAKEQTQQRADKFLKLNAIALIGVSEKADKFGNMIFNELKEKQINIFQLHSKHESLNNAPCYKSIDDMPEKPDGLIINVASNKTASLIEEYRKQGIQNFWIQRGSESPEAKKYCEDNNLDYVSGKCILMFAQPVKSVHSFHRTIWKWFGKS
ncbi:MAG: CoA-binding protein [Candidatus Kapabacteria bacterium]|nr:CoA-binding protein [Ignavibacteriota bacterium]MCW5885516.1 CoA-binding protein [Candidatus Kapabacteria bacterium]